MALCWFQATHKARDVLNVIQAFSSWAPALKKDGHWRRVAGEGACLLEISTREKTVINEKFSEPSFSPPKFYLSLALSFRWRWNGEFRFSLCEGKWKCRAASCFRFKLRQHKLGDSRNCFVHLHTWNQWRNSGHHAVSGSAPGRSSTRTMLSQISEQQ